MNTFGHSRIAGIGAHLPKTRVHSDDLMREVNCSRFGIPEDYISRHLGIVERRVADKNQAPSDLAALAAEAALADAGIAADELDFVIFAGITRDYEEPSTAHNVQKKLAATRASCMDVSNACLGFMSAMSVADAYINSGMAENVLVCSGELSSHTQDVFLPFLRETKDKQVFKRKFGVLTVGDAGGAMVVQRRHVETQGWEWFKTESDGAHSELCYYTKTANGYQGQMVMDKICAVTLTRHAKLFQLARENISWFGDGADYTYCHQVGSAPHKLLLSRFRLDAEKAPITYDRFGNLTTTTIPVLMDLNRPKPNQRIQFFCSGSGISVFQGGMTF